MPPTQVGGLPLVLVKLRLHLAELVLVDDGVEALLGLEVFDPLYVVEARLHTLLVALHGASLSLLASRVAVCLVAAVSSVGRVLLPGLVLVRMLVAQLALPIHD